jgi:Ca2+-dependent lipid-binding protein
LSLEIVEGQLIKDTELWGEMDPFVLVQYQDVKYKTATVKDGGRKPKWDETLEIPI